MLSWTAVVKQGVPSARGEALPILVNTMPALMDNLAEALDARFPRDLATDGSSIASEHGGERARLTRISPSDLIREYQLLRDVLVAAISPLDAREMSVLTRSLDQAMTESLTAYFLIHEGLRDQLATTLTHDLRTPLSAIKACAELILRRPDRVDQTPALSARIVDNVRRIDRMIQDLLDASTVSFGERIQFEVEPCELLGMVRETISQLATVHGDRFVVKGTEIAGHWNADAFKRAIENLVVNAIKYGDPTAPIEVAVEELGGRAILSVRNEGTPIPAGDQEGLFRSFMRAKSARTSGKRGWGLGLAMVRGMAEGHGGSVTVDSSPERGTRFVVDVPVEARPYLGSPLTPGATPIAGV